jgi:hypothetical protein
VALTTAQTEALYERAHRDLETRELCGEDFLGELARAINADGGEPHPDWKKMAAAPLGAGVPGNGKVLKELRGAGKVYDWRDSDWTPTNGGRINLRLFVQHIPVIRNVDGIADIVTLRNALVAQGLMVQCCTDREGNVGLFTPFDFLCYQAKGANQISCGCENMLFSTAEDWSKLQLRAMAWVIQLCERPAHGGVPQTRGRLGSGSGVVRVLEEGQVWHSEVSDAAGFHDRSDPWGDTPHDVVVERWEYVQHCIRFFDEHGHFEGA